MSESQRDNLKIAVVVAIILLIGALQARRSLACGRAGGVYLYREWRCVTGIQEIRP